MKISWDLIRKLFDVIMAILEKLSEEEQVALLNTLEGMDRGKQVAMLKDLAGGKDVVA